MQKMQKKRKECQKRARNQVKNISKRENQKQIINRRSGKIFPVNNQVFTKINFFQRNTQIRITGHNQNIRHSQPP